MKFIHSKNFSKSILNVRILTMCTFLITLVVTVISFYFYLTNTTASTNSYKDLFMNHHLKIININNSTSQNLFTITPTNVKKQNYKASLPVIFVGGYPRAGSGLVEQLIEHYGNIHCNDQTYVMTDVLKMGMKWEKYSKEMARLKEAKIDESVLFDAFTAFVQEILFGQSLPKASTLCVHESYSYIYMQKLNQMFPNSKFIFIIRDGRAVTHDLMLKKVSSSEQNSYYEGFLLWAEHMNDLLARCQQLGMSKCHMLRFEDLFISSEETIKKLFIFLELDVDLRDVKSFLNKTSVALDYFSGGPDISQEALDEAESIGRSLKVLGYNPLHYVPQNSFQNFVKQNQLTPFSSKDLHSVSVSKPNSDQDE